MPDVNELARTVQEAWDRQFTRAPDSHGPAGARTAAETVLAASGPRPAHDPAGDCTCEPYGGDRCEYRFLVDEILEALNPPGDDIAEVAILISAVKRAAGVMGGFVRVRLRAGRGDLRSLLGTRTAQRHRGGAVRVVEAVA